MKKLGILASLSAIVAALAIATFSSSTAAAGEGSAAAPATPCVRKEFKTDMVKKACETGGQPAAKDVMKKFNKDNKITSCNKCHSKLAPNYELKADGLKQFTDLGGK